jgi:DNA-binding XRE family transcriptional regulator
MVDTLKGSDLANRKELRPGSIRILFAFDHWRRSVLLVAGDKSGKWKQWHKEAIPFCGTALCELSRRASERGEELMAGYVRWSEIREEMIARAGGEDAVKEDVRRIKAEAQGFKPAEARRARGFTQQQIADRMGVTKGRISQIEQGSISGQEVLARYAEALGGHLQQSIFFEDGDIIRVA